MVGIAVAGAVFVLVALLCSGQGMRVCDNQYALCREVIGVNAAHYSLPLFAAWTGIQVG